MKKFRKIMAVVAAMAMTVAMSFGALADETDAAKRSITIENANKGQTYTLYKIFDATTSKDRQDGTKTEGITYTLPEGKMLDKTGETWFTASKDGYITAKDAATEGIKTDSFKEWAKSFGTQIGDPVVASKDGATVAWNNLSDGYYFISTTTGSLVTVTSIAPNATVKDKNGVPTVEKTVQEDSKANGKEGDGITGYQKKNDADLGQTVYYKTVIKAQAGAENYVLHDTMTHLTFGDIDSIKVGEDALTVITDYTVASTTNSFDVTFTKSFLDNINKETEITVLYHATVDQDAVIASTGNPNETWLDYGNDNHTTHRGTKTYVWKFNVLKYGDNDATKLLKGATFTLSKSEDGSNPLTFTAKDSTEANSTWKFDENGTVTSFTTKEDGQINFEGLDEGTYYLTETAAPDGYNKLTAPIKVVVESSTTNDNVDLTEDTADTNKTFTVKNTYLTTTSTGETVNVNNESGSALPTTGGMGTTILYVAGAILVIAGAAVLVIKKRHEA